jgi:hypothetical protein
MADNETNFFPITDSPPFPSLVKSFPVKNFVSHNWMGYSSGMEQDIGALPRRFSRRKSEHVTNFHRPPDLPNIDASNFRSRRRA